MPVVPRHASQQRGTRGFLGTALQTCHDWVLMLRDLLPLSLLLVWGCAHSARPETFREAKSILETFRAYAPTPYVVAANKQDMKDAWEVDDLRIALRLDESIKLLSCVATDKESVKSSLLELLYAILEEMEEDEEAVDGKAKDKDEDKADEKSEAEAKKDSEEDADEKDEKEEKEDEEKEAEKPKP